MKVVIEYDDGLPFAEHVIREADAAAWHALFGDVPGKTTDLVGSSGDSNARVFARDLVNAVRAAKMNLEASSRRSTPESVAEGADGREPKRRNSPSERRQLRPGYPIFRPVRAVVGHLRKLQSGGYGLPVTYWAFGSGIGVVFLSVTALTDSGGSLLFRMLLLLNLVLVWIGIWKAANRYRGRALWSGLAKATVVAIVMSVVVFMVVVALARS